MGRSFASGPGNVTIGHVPLAIDANREHARRIVAGAEENHAMSENRARDYRITIIADAPDFLAICRVVSGNHIARGADDLDLTVDRNDEGRAEGKTPGCLAHAISLPDDFTAG